MLARIDPCMAVAIGLAIALLAGCNAKVEVSASAICDLTRHQRNALNDAALIDAGPLSRVASANLIRTLDVACMNQ